LGLIGLFWPRKAFVGLQRPCFGLIWALKGLIALPGAFLGPTRPCGPKKAKRGLTLPERQRRALLSLLRPRKAFWGLHRPYLGLQRPRKALKGLLWALKGLIALPGAFLGPTRPCGP